MDKIHTLKELDAFAESLGITEHPAIQNRRLELWVESLSSILEGGVMMEDEERMNDGTSDGGITTMGGVDGVLHHTEGMLTPFQTPHQHREMHEMGLNGSCVLV